jgi:glutaredoxin
MGTAILRLFRWLFHVGRTGPGSLGHVRIVLYTRTGCHLCHLARDILLEAQQSYPFRLSEVDVDSDPDLADRYGEQVPVVMVNGKVRFRGTVNRALLQRLLQAEAQHPRRPREQE